ncbi:unnamed protein product [Didymodactylos carnosus]|uniref:Uncharacterized protein n=1 Tax=Didymodactylos carnosus TaxID=1234261 RepID=A0A814UW57_9BILA|nr:unnamed protein product [Didymodactylos carnosus]CAF3944836.1 unnamed protein product [Didymodactylos carnosus]
MEEVNSNSFANATAFGGADALMSGTQGTGEKRATGQTKKEKRIKHIDEPQRISTGEARGIATDRRRWKQIVNDSSQPAAPTAA